MFTVQHWQDMLRMAFPLKERYCDLLVIVGGTVLPGVANKHPPWLLPDNHHPAAQSAMNE